MIALLNGDRSRLEDVEVKLLMLTQQASSLT
jgi:hypothetical protein